MSYGTRIQKYRSQLEITIEEVELCSGDGYKSDLQTVCVTCDWDNGAADIVRIDVIGKHKNGKTKSILTITDESDLFEGTKCLIERDHRWVLLNAYEAAVSALSEEEYA
jgi:hypothetical protein